VRQFYVGVEKTGNQKPKQLAKKHFHTRFSTVYRKNCGDKVLKTEF